MWTVHHSTTPSAATWGVDSTWDDHVQPFNEHQVKFTLTRLLFPGYLLCCCHTISPSYSSPFCSLLHLNVPLSSALGFFSPFQNSLSPFSLYLCPFCASHWCVLSTSFLMFRSVCLSVNFSLSSAAFDFTILLFPSVSDSDCLSLSPPGLRASVLACLSVSCSYQAPWFITAIWVTYFCTNSHLLMLWNEAL